MHHKYHTDAIILSSKNSGEADRVFTLFTRDLGVLYAKATGIRKKESKLRYSLQFGSFARVDLVRGKDIWRITSASHVPFSEKIFKDKEKSKIYSKILSLIYRLYRSEDKEEALFDDLVRTVQIFSLDIQKDIKYDFFEISSVMMILSHLGYWKDEGESIPKPYELSLFEQVEKNRNMLVLKINRALRETQL